MERLILNQYSDFEINTFAKNPPRGDFVSQEIVDVSTMNEFCLSLGVDRIDLLEMDEQCWELNVLRGGKRMLCNRQI